MHVIALHVLPSIYLEWFPVTKNYYGQLNQYQYYSLAYNFFSISVSETTSSKKPSKSKPRPTCSEISGTQCQSRCVSSKSLHFLNTLHISYFPQDCLILFTVHTETCYCNDSEDLKASLYFITPKSSFVFYYFKLICHKAKLQGISEKPRKRSIIPFLV